MVSRSAAAGDKASQATLQVVEGSGFSAELFFSHDAVQKGGLFNKVKGQVEVFATQQIGASEYKINTLEINIEPELGGCFEHYRDAWYRPLREDGFGDKKQTKHAISKYQVFISRILQRFVAFMLADENLAKIDHAKYQKAIEHFVDKLKNNDQLLRKSDGNYSHLGKFLLDDHQSFLRNFRQILQCKRTMESHRAALAKAEDFMKAVEVLVERQLLAYWDTKTKPQSFEDRVYRSVLKKNEDDTYDNHATNNKYTRDINQQLNYLSDLSDKVPYLVNYLEVKSHIRAQPIISLYKILYRVTNTRKLIAAIATYLKATGWMSILTHELSLTALGDHINSLIRDISDDLNVKERGVLDCSSNAYNGLLRFKATRINNLLMDGIVSISTSLYHLDDPELHKVIRKNIKDNAGNIKLLQRKLGLTVLQSSQPAGAKARIIASVIDDSDEEDNSTNSISTNASVSRSANKIVATADQSNNSTGITNPANGHSARDRSASTASVTSERSTATGEQSSIDSRDSHRKNKDKKEKKKSKKDKHHKQKKTDDGSEDGSEKSSKSIVGVVKSRASTVVKKINSKSKSKHDTSGNEPELASDGSAGGKEKEKEIQISRVGSPSATDSAVSASVDDSKDSLFSSFSSQSQTSYDKQQTSQPAELTRTSSTGSIDSLLRAPDKRQPDDSAAESSGESEISSRQEGKPKSVAKRAIEVVARKTRTKRPGDKLHRATERTPWVEKPDFSGSETSVITINDDNTTEMESLNDANAVEQPVTIDTTVVGDSSPTIKDNFAKLSEMFRSAVSVMQMSNFVTLADIIKSSMEFYPPHEKTGADSFGYAIDRFCNFSGDNLLHVAVSIGRKGESNSQVKWLTEQGASVFKISELTGKSALEVAALYVSDKDKMEIFFTLCERAVIETDIADDYLDGHDDLKSLFILIYKSFRDDLITYEKIQRKRAESQSYVDVSGTIKWLVNCDYGIRRAVEFSQAFKILYDLSRHQNYGVFYQQLRRLLDASKQYSKNSALHRMMRKAIELCNLRKINSSEQGGQTRLNQFRPQLLAYTRVHGLFSYKPQAFSPYGDQASIEHDKDAKIRALEHDIRDKKIEIGQLTAELRDAQASNSVAKAGK